MKLLSLAIVAGTIAVSVLWTGIAWVSIADWWHRRKWQRAYTRQAVEVLRGCELYLNEHSPPSTAGETKP